MQVALIRGREFKHDLPHHLLAAAKTDISLAFAEAKNARQEVHQEFQQDMTNGPAVQTFLASARVKLACAIEAAGKRPLRNRPRLESLLAIPTKLSLDTPLAEIDRVRVRIKKDGQFRYIHDFGPLHRTAKQMVYRVLAEKFVAKDFQYTLSGIQTPIKLAKAELSDGKTFFATLDIRDHFGSFSTKKLAHLLPIPKEWVDYVVGGRHAVVKLENIDPSISVSPAKLLLQAQRGLPTGSICSPIVAASSIGALTWQPSSERTLINFADNFLLLATSLSEMSKAKHELIDAVRKLPGGKFSPRVVDEGSAGESFDYLGHSLKMVAGNIEIGPNLSNQEAIHAEGERMGNRVAKAMSCGDTSLAISHVKDYCTLANGWLAAFSECDEIEEYRAMLETLIVQNAFPLSFDAIKDAMLSAGHSFEYARDHYRYL